MRNEEDSELTRHESALVAALGAVRDSASREHDLSESELRSHVENADRRAALCGARHAIDDERIEGQAPAGPEVDEQGGARLTLRQSRAAAMLARGFSVRATADALGIHRGTLFRWRQADVAFEREVRRQSRISTAALAARARSLLLKATQQAERAFDRDEGSGTFASRLLGNRKLWDVAMAAGEGEADELT